jgi:biotin carboxyl carrier protein
MIFEVAVGDRLRTVSVVRKGTHLHVTLDGRLHVVDARRLSDSTLSLLVQNGSGDVPVRSVDAAFATLPAPGDFDVHLAGRSIAVQVRPSTWMTRKGASALRTGPASGPQRVLAPMPGKIVRVLVKAGDAVTARQGLVVVEAMKMENELRAARDGRVREVAVSEGQSVDAGAVLLVVE